MKTIEINQYIVADPDICGGKPTFRGTRVMVWQVLEMLAAGETVEQILEDFPSITREHIAAALRHAARLTEGEKFIPFEREVVG